MASELDFVPKIWDLPSAIVRCIIIRDSKEKPQGKNKLEWLCLNKSDFPDKTLNSLFADFLYIMLCKSHSSKSFGDLQHELFSDLSETSLCYY